MLFFLFFLKLPKKPNVWPGNRHPAVRPFQGLRIYVNQELDEFQRGLVIAENFLKPNAHCCAITFHSLEESLVKNFYQSCEKGSAKEWILFRKAVKGKQTEKYQHLIDKLSPKEILELSRKVRYALFPATMKIINKAPIYPTKGEIQQNPRARSARLRVAKKLDGPARHSLDRLSQIGEQACLFRNLKE